MIVLDTNVVSEMMRAEPDGRVAVWLAEQPALSIFTTSITEAEVMNGLLLLPSGRRRNALEAAARKVFAEEFSGRVLSFGREAASAYAVIRSERQRAGRPIAALDAQIASIARVVGARLATRNVQDFAACGVQVHNPWD